MVSKRKNQKTLTGEQEKKPENTPPPKNTKSRTLNNAITQGHVTGLNAISTTINKNKERQTRKATRNATTTNVTRLNNDKLAGNMSRLFNETPKIKMSNSQPKTPTTPSNNALASTAMPIRNNQITQAFGKNPANLW